MTARLLPSALLNTQPNIQEPDDFYQELVDMHRDLSEQQSALVNAKLKAAFGHDIAGRGRSCGPSRSHASGATGHRAGRSSRRGARG